MPLSLFLPTHVTRAGDIYAALLICFYTLFDAAFLSPDIAVLQLFLVTCSTACPISFSQLLKVTGFIEGIFNVHSKLFRWVSPIPVCRHARTALELTS